MNFKNLTNTRFKKALFGFGVVVVIALILALTFWIELGKSDKFLFLAKVPDYSTPKGYAIVNLKDYEKYQQGYCLEERRILDKEEIIKRGIVNYFKKEAKLDYMLVDEYCRVFGIHDPYCAYGKKQFIDFVGLNYSEELNENNWYEKLKVEYDKIKDDESSWYDFKKIFFDTFKAKHINITTDDIYIEDNKAGFNKVLIYYNGIGWYFIYSGTNLIISRERQAFRHYRWFAVVEGFGSKTYLTEEKESYDKETLDIENTEKFDTTANQYSQYKIDNCGYIYRDIEEYFNKHKDNIGKGG